VKTQVKTQVKTLANLEEKLYILNLSDLFRI